MAKFRATINVMVDFFADSDEQASERAEAIARLAFTDHDLYRMQVKISKLRDRRKTVQLGEFPIHAVLPYIRCDDSKREYQIGDKTYKVRMNSQRYFIFRESCHCAACGLAGTVMVLEQNPHDKNPHFNLYGVEDGKYILMTKDHVLPKAFGGEDRHSNYQTMCSVCNGLKGSENISLEGIRELRSVYNENRAEPRKKVKDLLDKTRGRHTSTRIEPKIPRCRRKQYQARKKALEEYLITNIDVNVYRLIGGHMLGRSVYEMPPEGAVQVACIREGTRVHAMGDDGGGGLRIRLSDDQWFYISQGYIDFKDSRPC